MKIGLLSDTHTNIKNLNGAVEFLKSSGAEIIIHLGDDYTDIDECGEEDILRVPGVFSDMYQDPEIPNRRIEDFLGWRVLLSHTVSSHENDLPDDIEPEELIRSKKIDVVLYGHTHIPDIKREEGIIYINPGHLKDEDKKGYPPTFCLLDFTEYTITIEIYELNNKSIFKEEFFKKEEQCY